MDDKRHPTHSDKIEDNESVHWADSIARELVERVKYNPVLQKIVSEQGYIVYDEKTPSGDIHIGSGRGWVIHDAIAKALREIGIRARFILSSDDLDPFDKMNEILDPSFEKYLGMPFRNIPSPVSGYKSFADYYFQRAVSRFAEFGIDAELESTGGRYIDGSFNKTIKLVLDNTEKVRVIYTRFYGADHSFKNRLPFNPICDSCGKIGTTETYAWDPVQEHISYRCRKDLVKWAQGCGHEGRKSPYNGGGKFPWKVEWAAKWPTVGVICETAGKDHFTKGGSRDIAVAICDEIFNHPVPYPSTIADPGKGYEFFTVGGKKMSTSKGRGISFAESTNYAPAKILRYLLIRTRPHAVIDFDPADRNDMILLYERFDKTERSYYGLEEGEDVAESAKQRRIYELSHIGPIPKKMIPQIPFIHASLVIQACGFDDKKALETLKKTGHLAQVPSIDEESYARERLGFAKNWIQNFAPEEFRFTLQESAAYQPTDENERNALRSLIDTLDKDLTDEALFNEFYNICNESGLDNKKFFALIYKILIGKERGPRLAPFINTLGKERVLPLLEEALRQ